MERHVCPHWGIALALLFVLIRGFCRPANASIFYVNKASSAAAPDGRTWGTAFTTVHSAITAAKSGDEVWVASGEYDEHITISRPVVLRGGFAGSERARTQRIPSTPATILDAGWTGRVVTIAGGFPSGVVLDRLSLRHGIGDGAAIRCDSNAHLRVQGCIISSNVDPAVGGSAIHAAGLSGGVFVNNAVVNNAGIGIVTSSQSVPIFIIRNTISGNAGNGVVGSQTVCIGSNVFSGNGAMPYSGLPVESGGGVWMAATCSNNVFVANRALHGSAAYGVTSFVNNTVVSNAASPQGGAVVMANENGRFVNNVIAFNSSGFASGGWTPSRFAGNCVYGNTEFDYNGMTNPTGKNGNISVNPGVVDVLRDPHLRAGSPCIGAGDDNEYTQGWCWEMNPPRMDVDGQPRVIGSHVDIGADEVEFMPNAPSTLFVRPDGNDASSGTSWRAAKRTIQAAINALPARASEVLVAAGTYQEAISLPWYVALRGGYDPGAPARLERQPFDHPTFIVPPDVLTAGQTGVSPDFSVLSVFPGGSPSIEGIVFCAGAYNAVRIPAASPALDRCILIGGITGLTSEDAEPTVEGSTFLGFGRSAMAFRWSQPMVVSNAVAYNSGDLQSAGVLDLSSSSGLIANNTFEGNANAYGAVTPRWGSAVELANNIFDNNVVGIAADAASKGLVTLDNNCVHANGTDYEGIADVTGANGNIRADPLLADPAHNNFHIQPQSPCHDAGENGAVAPGETDIDGLARIIGSSVDIGADESDPRVWPIASPPVIRVSTTGSDTNDGSSWARAKRTVSNALRSAGVSAGEVWVAGGTYASGIVIPPNVGLLGGFSPRAGDRGRRDPASIVTVLAGSGVMFTGAGPASRVDGLVIRGGGVACSGGSPLISNCAITGCSGSGIDVRYGSTPHITGNQIAGNGLSNPSSKSGAGIYAWEASPVVANNIIRGNGGGGVQIMESEGTLVRDNLISSNGSEQYAAPGIAVWHGSLTATNNTVVGNKGLGLMVYSPDHQSVFVNNIVARNGAAVLAYADTFRNNDFTGPNLGLAESLIGRSGNISADPLFVDYASGDFHLKAGSPCIDTGDDSVIATWESDLDGRSRKGGPHVDMGCYEWLP